MVALREVVSSTVRSIALISVEQHHRARTVRARRPSDPQSTSILAFRERLPSFNACTDELATSTNGWASRS